MPSFDIVSKTDMQQVDNAVQSVIREVAQRYDFKGSNCEITRDDALITVIADDNYKLEQIQMMLKGHFVKKSIDPKSLDMPKPEMASGNTLRQKITVKQGIDSDLAKKIIKEIKAEKFKVQVSIRGEEVRVEGKKRDDLQQVISFVKGKEYDLPLQFINFRD